MSARTGVLIFMALLIAVVLQTSLVGTVMLAARPNLLVALVTGFGLIGGPLTGLATGAVAGLLLDIMAGRLIGLGLLAFSAAGGVAGLVGHGLFRENFFVSFAAGAAVSGLYHLLFLLGARAFGVFIPFWDSLVNVLLPALWYNGLLAGVLFPLMQRAARWVESLSDDAVVQRRRR